jgi:hypothetical protein
MLRPQASLQAQDTDRAGNRSPRFIEKSHFTEAAEGKDRLRWRNAGSWQSGSSQVSMVVGCGVALPAS